MLYMASIINVATNTTIRLSCHDDDIMIWCSPKGLLSRSKDSYKILDFWELRSDELITITNRIEDLPSWFNLNPLEVSGKYVNWMEKKLNQGYEPGEIVDAPNLWRVRAGHCIAHIKSEKMAEPINIYQFNENALIIGEPGSCAIDLKRYVFGCPDQRMEKDIFKKFAFSVPFDMDTESIKKSLSKKKVEID